MAMAITVDPKVAPYYEWTFILGSCICCRGCGIEPVYESKHRQFTNENYYDQAVAMRDAGWVVVPSDTYASYCPQCAKERRLRPSGEAI